jgi:2-polyprenyl-3-methyl-5-hydroxy-6-metoxy-1,4-benzoquinol methylase
MKSDRPMLELEEERAVPWRDPGQFTWHLARYQFALGLASGRRVLDVGSGEGYGAALLAQVAREVVAVDYSPAAVEHGRASYPRHNLRFEVADVITSMAAFGRFDLVTCLEVIEHIEDDNRLLENLARSLAPGGTVILSTPNALVDALFEAVSPHEHYAYHVNLLAPPALRRRMLRHFKMVTLYGQSYAGRRPYTILKSLDVFNLRHRLVRSPRLQDQASRRLGRPAIDQLRPDDFVFSRRLVRQSPHIIAVARNAPAGADG